MASWLARSTPVQALRVRALAGDIVFLGKTLKAGVHMNRSEI